MTFATAVHDSDRFVVIGNSVKVYPAEGFVKIADKARVETLEISLVRNGQVFDRSIFGNATQTVPEWERGLI